MFPLYVRTTWNTAAKQHYNVIWNKVSVTSRKHVFLGLNISSVTDRNSNRYSEFHNYAQCEGSERRRKASSTQRHCIGLFYNQWPSLRKI